MTSIIIDHDTMTWTNEQMELDRTQQVAYIETPRGMCTPKVACHVSLISYQIVQSDKRITVQSKLRMLFSHKDSSDWKILLCLVCLPVDVTSI